MANQMQQPPTVKKEELPRHDRIDYFDFLSKCYADFLGVVFSRIQLGCVICSVIQVRVLFEGGIYMNFYADRARMILRSF